MKTTFAIVAIACALASSSAFAPLATRAVGKKPAAKKVVAKKVVAKKKPVAKKVVAKKPVARKAAVSMDRRCRCLTTVTASFHVSLCFFSLPLLRDTLASVLRPSPSSHGLVSLAEETEDPPTN